MVDSDVFSASTAGTATDTWWTLWSMGSRFQVGGHRVEVTTWHWTGLHAVAVDGREVYRDRNVGWHARIAVDAGPHAVAIVSRWYPLQPVRVQVDGRPYLDDLFPQVFWLQALGVATALPPALLFALSIAWDLWRMAQLAAQL
jgi:hypothetical protein